VDVARARVPEPTPDLGEGRYLKAIVRSMHPEHPAWSAPVAAYLRPIAAGYQVVGIER